MTKNYESRLIPAKSGKIAYFKFTEASDPQSFPTALAEFKKWAKDPQVNYIVVNVEMESAWNKEVQHAWIETGVVADQEKLTKWGVVSKDTSKQLTIKYLIKGAGSPRKYETLVATDEKECLAWIDQ